MIRRRVRLPLAHQLDRLNDAWPFAFDLFGEGDDQQFQAQERRRLNEIFQLFHRFVSKTISRRGVVVRHEKLFRRGRRNRRATRLRSHRRGEFRRRFDRAEQKRDDRRNVRRVKLRRVASAAARAEHQWQQEMEKVIDRQRVVREGIRKIDDRLEIRLILIRTKTFHREKNSLHVTFKEKMYRPTSLITDWGNSLGNNGVSKRGKL